MIKAIVLDIDGVIIGTKKGINFPHPSKHIIEILMRINKSGIPVVFITAKTSFAASANIEHVGIDNLHISDGGAVIFNPVRKEVINIKPLLKSNLEKILNLMPNNVLINLFTLENYYIAKNIKENKRFANFIKRYAEFMERHPIVVENLSKVAIEEKVLKINVVALDKKERDRVTLAISNANLEISFKWTGAPYIAPAEILSITDKGISKKESVKKVAQDMRISLDEILGVGDTIQDWDFLQICGYKATLINATEELKNKFDFSDQRQFMGRHVDEDGLIDILKHFSIG